MTDYPDAADLGRWIHAQATACGLHAMTLNGRWFFTDAAGVLESPRLGLGLEHAAAFVRGLPVLVDPVELVRLGDRFRAEVLRDGLECEKVPAAWRQRTA
jgi:hypothetical protein